MKTLCLAVAAVAALACLPAAANRTHAHLQALSDPQRAAVLARIVRSGGESCSSVTRSYFQGSDRTGAAFWNVQCAGGKSWSILIRNDATGSARLLDCEALEAAQAGTCFRRF